MFILIFSWIVSAQSQQDNVYCQMHITDFPIWELDGIIALRGKIPNVSLQMTSWDSKTIWHESISFNTDNEWNFIRLEKKDPKLEIITDQKVRTKPITMYSSLKIMDGQYDMLCVYQKRGITSIEDYHKALADKYISTKEFRISFWMKTQKQYRSYNQDHIYFITHTRTKDYLEHIVFQIDFDFDQLRITMNEQQYSLSLDYQEILHWSQILIVNEANATTFKLITILSTYEWSFNGQVIDLPNGYTSENTTNLIIIGITLNSDPLECPPDCVECNGLQCLKCQSTLTLVNGQCQCSFGMLQNGTSCQYPIIKPDKQKQTYISLPLAKPCNLPYYNEPEFTTCISQKSLSNFAMTTFKQNKRCPKHCTNCGQNLGTFRCYSCIPNIGLYLGLDGFCHLCDIKNCLVCYQYSKSQLSLLNNFVYEYPNQLACAQCEEGYSYSYDDGICVQQTLDCPLSIIVNAQPQCLIHNQNAKQIQANCQDPCQVCKKGQCLRCQSGYYLSESQCIECRSPQCALNDPMYDDFWKTALQPIFAFHGKIFQQSQYVQLIHYSCADTRLIICNIPQIKPNPLFYTIQTEYNRDLWAQQLIVLRDMHLSESLILNALKVQLFNITTNGYPFKITTQKLYINKLYLSKITTNKPQITINSTFKLIIEINNLIIDNCVFNDTGIFLIQQSISQINLIIKSITITNTRFINSKMLLLKTGSLSSINTQIFDVRFYGVQIISGENFFGRPQMLSVNNLRIVNTQILNTQPLFSSYTNCTVKDLVIENVKLEQSTFMHCIARNAIIKDIKIQTLQSNSSILFKIFSITYISEISLLNSTFINRDDAQVIQIVADRINFHNLILENIYGTQPLFGFVSRTVNITNWSSLNSLKCPSLLHLSKYKYVNIYNMRVNSGYYSTGLIFIGKTNQEYSVINMTQMHFQDIQFDQWSLIYFANQIGYLSIQDTYFVNMTLIDNSPMLILQADYLIMKYIIIQSINHLSDFIAVSQFQANQVRVFGSTFTRSGKQIYSAAGIVIESCNFQEIQSDYVLQIQALKGNSIIMNKNIFNQAISVLEIVGNYQLIDLNGNHVSEISESVYDIQIALKTIIKDHTFFNIEGQILKLHQVQNGGSAFIQSNRISSNHIISNYQYLFEIYNGDVTIQNLFINRLAHFIYAEGINVVFTNIVIRKVAISTNFMDISSKRFDVQNFIIRNIDNIQIKESTCSIQTLDLNVKNVSLRNANQFIVYNQSNQCYMCGDIYNKSICLFNHKYQGAQNQHQKMRFKLKSKVRSLNTDSVMENDTISHFKVNETFYLPTGDMSTYERLYLKKQVYVPYQLNPQILIKDQNNSKCRIEYLDKNISFMSGQVIPFNLTITKERIQFKSECSIENMTYRLDFNARVFPCQVGEIVRNEICKPCDIYQYSLNPKDRFCTNIDEYTMVSVNKALINLKSGYWRPHLLSSKVSRCLDERCLGGWKASDVSCTQGYLGATCHECDLYNIRGDGKFTKNSNNKCVPCSWNVYKFLEAVLLIIIQLSFIFITVDSYEQDIQKRKIIRLTHRVHTPLLKLQLDKNEIILKLLKDYIQKILYTNIVALSSFITLRFSLTYISNSSISLNQSLECFISQYIPEEYMIYMSLPLLVLIQILILNLFLTFIFIYKNKMDQKFSIIQVSTCVFYLALFNITNYFNQLMTLITPKWISGIHWVQANLSYRYDSPLHQWLTMFGLVPQTLIICLVAPLMLYLLLRQARKTGHSLMNRMLQYFTIQYHQVTYFWEIQIIWVRLFIIINMKIFIDDLYARIFMFLLVLHIVQKISTHYKPYNLYILNFCDSLLRNLLCIAIIIMGLIETQQDPNVTLLLQILFYVVNIIGLTKIFLIMMRIMQRKKSPVYTNIASKILSQKYLTNKELQQSQSIVNFQKVKLNPKLKSLVVLNRQVYNSSAEAIQTFTTDLAQTSLNITMTNINKSAITSPQIEEELIKEQKFATFRKFSYENPQEYE